MERGNEEGNEAKQDYEKHIDRTKDLFNSLFKDMCKLEPDLDNFKKQQIPVARIKKVMKTDEDVNVSLVDGQQRCSHNNGQSM